MTQFEFLMMIASVVVAVGMTEIVGGWGRLARADGEIKFDWLHLGWTIYILLLSVQYWIGMWSYRELRIEYVGQIFSSLCRHYSWCSRHSLCLPTSLTDLKLICVLITWKNVGLCSSPWQYFLSLLGWPISLSLATRDWRFHLCSFPSSAASSFVRSLIVNVSGCMVRC